MSDEKAKAHYQRYLDAAHAMQSGVAMNLNYEQDEASPKSLRVGVNSAMVEHGALVKVLTAAGIITDEQYFEALADGMEAEVESYRMKIQERFPGTKIDLA